ncbi:MAG: polysaccharide biosynthesis C-terminal domain-containing protein [Lachnospiraceae bacterium]|nr:polysaccharide biosynthesis C-terminal domain-containing protein [Lachnospiraceae bacterium]
MKIASTKKTMRGIFFGTLNKIIKIVMPFVLRSILIHKIGTEYAGLSSLFTSILRVLNIAELGFASAAAYSLYKPVADEDTDKVCALLSFYRKIYRVVGAAVMIAGLMLLPFLEHLIKGGYPADINLKLLYIIYLLDSSASYFLFSYKNLVLNVYQRMDVISIINMTLHMIVYALQIIVLVVFRAYYVFVILQLVFTVVNNLTIARYVTKHFPQYKCRGVLPKTEKKDIVKNTYGMFLFKVCSATRNSLDTVFVSAFIGLTAATIYGNYYYIFAGVASIQTIIRESMQGGIGNKIAMNTPEKNHKDMLVFMYMYAWLSGAFTACMLCLYQPFVQIWVGKKLMLDEPTAIMFCVYFYVLSMGSIRFLYHQAAGLFWKKRYWTIAEALINVAGNYILVQLWGMFGVVCSTIISLLTVDFFYSTTIVYDYYFKNGQIGVYFKKHGLYLIITALGCTPAYLICRQINIHGVLGLAVRLVVCLAVSNAVFFTLYRRLPEYGDAKKIAQRITGIVTAKLKR